MTDAAETSHRLRVVLSDDRMEAYVQIADVGADSQFMPPAATEVRAALERAQVVITPEVEARIDVFIARCNAAVNEFGQDQWRAMLANSEQCHLLAEGTPPVDAVDGAFEWAAELDEKLARPSVDVERVNYFALNGVITVGPGTLVGRVTPAVQGHSGYDVQGAEVVSKRPQGQEIKIGFGLEARGEHPLELYTTVAGRVLFSDDHARVCEVLKILGDIDFRSGSVDACVDVTVHGTVQSNFHVYTTKSLTVNKGIEAADVRVGGDITVKGGIFGQDEKGQVDAEGAITAHLINEARVRAGGNIHFHKEVLNSHVFASGALVGERGTLIGGRIYAREGIRVRRIGSDADVVTQVTTGIHSSVLRQIRDIEDQIQDCQRAAEDVRAAVEPMVADLKRLGPTQRERAAELLSQAEELNKEIVRLREEAARLEREGQPQEEAAIVVHQHIHRGAHLAIGPRVARVRELIQGPTKVVLREVDGSEKMIAVHQLSGSITVLPSKMMDLEALDEDELCPELVVEDASEQAATQSEG